MRHRGKGGTLVPSFFFSSNFMPLIKNPKGTIVSVTKEQKQYLLLDNPPVLDIEGNPRKNNNGKIATHLKAAHEFGWKEPTADEVKTYEDQLAEDQEAAEAVTLAHEAAGITVVAAALAAKRASDADQKNAAGKGKVKAGGPGRKTKAEKEAEAKLAAEEMEKRVRDAEGDKDKYEALSDDEKELYVQLGLPEIVA